MSPVRRFLSGWLEVSNDTDGTVVLPPLAGTADVWGDGIVPLPAALLAGSTQLVLDGVYHSPIGAAKDEAQTAEGARLWYGSEPVLDSWLPSALGEAAALTA